GRVVLSGPFAQCQSYFEGIGFPCPTGFNIADYLVDLTVKASEQEVSQRNSQPSSSTHSVHDGVPRTGENHSEQPNTDRLAPPTAGPAHTSREEVNSSAPNKSLLEQGAEFFMRKMRAGNSGPTAVDAFPKDVHLDALVKTYAESEIAKHVKQEITSTTVTNGTQANGSGQMRDVTEETNVLRGRRRASWATQFKILSGRAFKNLYRDPALMTAHYVASIVIAIVCGLLVHNVTNDIPGFQNRLGFFFFTLSLFGFACLSSLGLFANERILFMRERANGYYASGTYFTSKVLFDVVPLRVVPALVYGSIVYGLVGLVPSIAQFWKFLLALVLFNLTAASVVLFVSIAIENTAVAGLVGTLIMLENLLFAGLLVNRNAVAPYLDWLFSLSFFHAAYEGMLVNELRYLTLKERKFGVDLDVAAAAILSSFGFQAQAFWWPDMITLGILCATMLILAFLWLHFFVKEKR
ncbi:hypothetical protein FRC16_005390, partial [Serendipita sp. 398]